MLTASNAQVGACLSLARAISTSRTVEEIYETALDALADALSVSRSSVLLFDPDGVIRFKASRLISDRYRAAVEGHSPWTPGTQDPEPILVPDVAQEPSLAPYLNVITAEGIAAMAFIPLVSRGRVIGKFMLYFDAPHIPSADDVQVASLIAAQVAFAVERKRAEQARLEAVEESRRVSERLAAIVESSGDAIVSKTLDGVITSWNSTAERMFGHSAAEAVGRSITLILPPDRWAEEQTVIARIRAGEQVEMETERLHRDGTRIPVSLMVSPVRDAQGRIIGASKVARDISARKRHEAERAELHRRLSVLVQASASLLDSPETQSVVAATISLAQQLLVADGYAVWTSDANGTWRVLESAGVSEAFASRVLPATIHSAPPAAALRSGPLAVTDVASHPIVAGQFEAYRQEGIESMLVCPMRLGTDMRGTLVFYYRRARSFADRDLETGQTLANLSAAAITTADLYEKLRAERNAAEAARRRAAFLADATAILTRSLDYEQTFAAVARLAVPEIADWCVVDVVDQHGHLQRVAMAHADPPRLDQARALQERYPPDPDTAGGAHEVIRTGRPAMTASITPEMIAAYARDEEHRRLLEGIGLTSYMCVPLLSVSGTLGAITLAYAEAGRHYTDADLAFVQELASRAALAVENALAYQRVNEASRLKDEFLATLSHELRTPLNAILGYSQMLHMGALAGERQSNAIAVLMRNAESLKQIIEDVLDVSRITSGKLRLSVRPLDVRDTLRNAVSTVQPAADAKGVQIHTSIDAVVPPVLGDPDRLQQIAWNLLSNAVKFTPRGGRVELTLEEVSTSVQIIVRDSGQGIQPAFLPHLFQRFRQADSRFSREHGGLGLGLALVRELTELHGGIVFAASEGPGRGATFTVRLPAMTMPAHSGGRETRVLRFNPAAASQPIPDRLRGVRVLAVDNEEDALGLLRVTLESAGAHVTSASSGRDALDLLQRCPFDVLIADIGMPQMDGFELIKRIRTTLAAPVNQIPAAALTAYTRGADRSAALSNGFQMHLPKPFHPNELVIAVAALIGR